jgi:hypothetical protein
LFLQYCFSKSALFFKHSDESVAKEGLRLSLLVALQRSRWRRESHGLQNNNNETGEELVAASLVAKRDAQSCGPCLDPGVTNVVLEHLCSDRLEKSFFLLLCNLIWA